LAEWASSPGRSGWMRGEDAGSVRIRRIRARPRTQPRAAQSDSGGTALISSSPPASGAWRRYRLTYGETGASNERTPDRPMRLRRRRGRVLSLRRARALRRPDRGRSDRRRLSAPRGRPDDPAAWSRRTRRACVPRVPLAPSASASTSTGHTRYALAQLTIARLPLPGRHEREPGARAHRFSECPLSTVTRGLPPSTACGRAGCEGCAPRRVGRLLRHAGSVAALAARAPPAGPYFPLAPANRAAEGLGSA
jgi:hypothetical protein